MNKRVVFALFVMVIISFFSIQLIFGIPLISFTNPTPENASMQLSTSIYVNISSSDSNEHYTITNFDNSILLWLRAEGNANDELGRNNATLSGTTYASGKYNQTFFLDGVNDYVNTKDSLMSSPGMMCTWFKTNYSNGTLYGVQDVEVGGTPSWYVPVLYLIGGKLIGEYGWYGSCNQVNTTYSVSDNLWHHVCLGYNGTYDFMYVDGDIIGSRKVSVALNTYQQIGTGQTTGCWGLSGWNYFNGSIDEFLFFNRTLSSQEVKSLYNATANQYANNFTNLAIGNHSFTGYSINTLGEKNQTDLRKIQITTTLPDLTPPAINFTYPTPENGTITDNIFVEINISVLEQNLSSFVYNWNWTNFNFYNDSLILMMNFDNKSTLNENSTYVEDFSKYRDNGTIMNASWISSGKYGGAFTFNGNNSYIKIRNNESFNFYSNPFSASLWFKANNFATNQKLISKTQSGGWSLDFEGGYLQFVVYNHTYRRTFYPEESLETNNWYHVTGVWNLTNINLYVNGKLVYTNSTTGFVKSTSSPLCIGSEATATDCIGEGRHFNGSIDEVRIWNRSLSSEEVYQEYSSNLQKFNQTQWYFYINQSRNSTTGLDNGTYTYQAFATDKSGNVNSTDLRTITIGQTEESIYPSFSGYWDNNASANGTTGYFNVTLSNTNGTVIFQFNNTNYTASNNSATTSNVFNVSIPGLSNGTYEYLWSSWGNGTIARYNFSEIRYYSVNEQESPVVVISNCTPLTSENTKYVLANDVNSTSTCFNILANNVTLDCAGFVISSNNSVNGINISRYNYSTIKNCNITVKTGSSSVGGIYIYASHNNSLINNSIRGPFGVYSLYLMDSNLWNNTISSSLTTVLINYGYRNYLKGNTIIGGGSDTYFSMHLLDGRSNYAENNTFVGSIGVRSSNNILKNNILNEGVWADDQYPASVNNTVYNNTIIVNYFKYTPGAGITIRTSLSNSWNFTSNNISGNGTGIKIVGGYALSTNNNFLEGNFFNGKPVLVYYNQSNLLFENNDSIGNLLFIKCNNVSLINLTLNQAGLYFEEGDNLTILNSNINTTDYSVIIANSSNSLLSGNILFSKRRGSQYGGLVLSLSNFNNGTIFSNNISGEGREGGGIVLSRSDYNNLSDNIISVCSYSSSWGGCQGILLSSSNNNTLLNHRVTAYRQGACPGYTCSHAVYLATSRDNTFINLNSTSPETYSVYSGNCSRNNFYDSMFRSSGVNDIFFAHSSCLDSYVRLINSSRYNGNVLNASFGTGNNNTLIMNYYLDANVTDATSGGALGEVNVTVLNNLSQTAFSVNTSGDGTIPRQTLTQYIRNGTSGTEYTWYSPYSLTAALAGYTTYTNESVNLTTNVNMNINLDAEFPPVVTLHNPQNNQGQGRNVSFIFSANDSGTISNCSIFLNEIINDTLTTIVSNVNYTLEIKNLEIKEYNWSVKCADIYNNIGESETRIFSIVQESKFSGGSTTNFSAINVSKISNLIIDSPEYGKINFSQNVDLSSGADIDDYVNISFNRIEINSSALSSLNKKAKLALYNLTFSNPKILRDGSSCSDCIKEEYSGGTLIFNVTGFSVYSAEEDSGGGGGGGGGSGGSSPPVITKIIPSKEETCYRDSDCTYGKSCYFNKCVKLFDVKIINLPEEIYLGKSINLEYYIKGVADISGDVIVNFWIQNDEEKYNLGKDTIYMGVFEEKTENVKLLVPKKAKSGDYDLYTEVEFQGYKASSFRKIEVADVQLSPYEEKSSAARIIIEIAILALLMIVIVMLGSYIKKRKFEKLGIGSKEVPLDYWEKKREKKDNFGKGIFVRIKEKIILIYRKLTDKGIRNVSELYGQEVFLSDGKFVGNVEEIYLSGKFIDKIMIKLNSSSSIELGRERIRLPYMNIKKISGKIILSGNANIFIDKMYYRIVKDISLGE